MNINLKSLKGYTVYRSDSLRPWGVVSSASLNAKAEVVALLIDTISLIPISYLISIQSISHIKNHSLHLKSGNIEATYVQKDFFTMPESLMCVAPPIKKTLRLYDFNFDMESGEITDIVVSKTRLAKKNKISINNIFIKDNTIYIE